jgi:RNA polymerase sigma-70 factor (ECF subfamily)
MSHFTDQELVIRYRAGREEALVELIQRFSASLYRFIWRLIGDSSMAEDLVQETFLKVWKHLSSFREQESFKAWIFSIARHLSIDYLRKKKMMVFSAMGEEEDAIADTIADERPLILADLEQQEVKFAIQEALEQLSPPAKMVVLLHDEEELTFEEIAQVTAEPMNTVKSRYRRALQNMRVYLESKSANVAPKF